MFYRFETLNSVYLIDEETQLYFRMPRTAEERNPHPSDKLKDSEWLPMAKWTLEKHPYDGKPVLRLWGPNSVNGIITSPLVSYPEGIEIKESTLL